MGSAPNIAIFYENEFYAEKGGGGGFNGFYVAKGETPPMQKS